MARKIRAAAPEHPAGGPQEVELKLALREGQLGRLRARLDRLAAPATSEVDSAYFDTAQRHLARRRAALRLRALRQGSARRWVQTFKTGDSEDALSVRGEWETPAPGGRIDPARLAHSPLGAMLLAVAGAHGSGGRKGAVPPLLEQFRTRFTRTVWQVFQGRSHIEVALDAGEVLACGRSEAILELELELRAGRPRDLLDLALELSAPREGEASIFLLPAGESKAARGYRLADGTARAPLPARAPGPLREDEATNATLAARSIIRASLAVVLGNAEGAARGEDPEFVHQARVALRRARTALALLQPAGKEARRVRSILRDWARRLGPARDWDVILREVLPAIAAGAGTSAPWRWARVAGAARVRSEVAREEAGAFLRSGEFSVGALRVLRWCGDTSGGREGGESLRRALRPGLRATDSHFRAAAARLAQLTPAECHALRVSVKRLRYGLELMRQATGGGARAGSLRMLAQLQDAIGGATDAALAEAKLCALTRSSEVQDAVRAWAARREAQALAQASQILQ
jgi:triphosphatase